MLYRQKSNTFIRQYEDLGYIINKNDESDKVVDASGAAFLRVLTREPQNLDTLCSKILASFTDTDFDNIKENAIEFYSVLENSGFIVSGQSKEELDAKDPHFSYASSGQSSVKSDLPPLTPNAKPGTRDFLVSRFKDNPLFMSLQIELTSRCNERCIHCYIPHQNKTTDMSPALFYDILDQCHDMGVITLALSGGELMLHPHFLDFLRRIKEYDFSIGILTNLTLLNDDIISELKTTRLEILQTSLYSMTPEVHDSITKLSGSFYKTRDNILRLIDNDIPLKISCPTMKQNKNDYKNVIQWAVEHKCSASTDYIMMARSDHTTDNLNNRLSLDEAEILINDILNYDPDYQKQINMTDFYKPDSRYRGDEIVCGVCQFSLSISANGNVFPCVTWDDRLCGNANETSLHEIWHSSPVVKYLRNLRKRDFPKCLDCKDSKFCTMCMVRNANENPQGDPLLINEHFCKIAALNHKLVLDWKNKKTAA